MALVKGKTVSDLTEDSDDESDSCIEREDTTTTLSKLRVLLKKLKRSEKLMNKYKSCCEITNVNVLSPVLDVTTRWNSSYDMIAMALRVRNALDALCDNNVELRDLKITNTEWILMSEVHKFLHDFKRLSTLLSGENYCSLPLVVVGFNMLLDKVERKVAELDEKPYRAKTDVDLLFAYQAARDKMIKHYRQTNWIYCAILILDPRHKKETFEMTVWGKDIMNQSIEIFERIYRDNYFTPSGQNLDTFCSNVTEDNDKNSDENDFIDFSSLYFFKKHVKCSEKSDPHNTSNTSKISVNSDWRCELEAYYSMERAQGQKDILMWWCRNEEKFPILSKMARDFLCIQATSVSSERLFSRASLTISKTRNRLSPSTSRSLLCINSWVTCSLHKKIENMVRNSVKED